MSDATIGAFALDLSKFGEGAVDHVQDIYRRTAMGLLVGIVNSTPVDEGRARANWQASINAPATGEVSISGSPGAAADLAIAAATPVIDGARGDCSIYLTNNLPYIDALEHGHSKQAPAGMVRQNIARFPYLIDQAVNFEGGGGI